VIRQAAFAMKFDFTLVRGDMDWNRLLICEECLEYDGGERFVYGLIPEQEIGRAD
jgi:hypothetical protein